MDILYIRNKLNFTIYWVFTAYVLEVNEKHVGVDLTRFANKLFKYKRKWYLCANNHATQ